ncbi:MAG: aldo/keto reductase family protein [Propionibacteriaceae bacterium]|jgi:aryl-alcohol dehydrogenase-like predicted oxidoreductase|nr:aldo/keto reductase family protein [Propionibacteriaceae bacterium]
MQFRYLGNSGLKVSSIAYGNWLTHASQIDNDRANRCVHAALEAGITTFDTADVYANTAAETVLASALTGVRRESIELCTKVYWPTGPMGPNDCGLSRKHIRESIAGSLKRLRTDYVDIYWCHRYDFGTPLEETLSALADLVHAGQVLYLGVSEWPVAKIAEAHALAAEFKVPLVASQPQYSMLHRSIEAEIVPTCAALGIGQVVFSPMAQGILTGKYAPGQPVPAGSRADDPNGGAAMITRWLKRPEVLERVQKLAPVAADENLTMAQLALAWVLTCDNVAAAIAGASRPEQITEAAAACDKTLSPETLARIDAALGDVVERDPSATGASPLERPA